ncbi:hypothetical protein [Leptospira interrogans]|nr:hypothetical protein [Leptospira interrogans]
MSERDKAVFCSALTLLELNQSNDVNQVSSLYISCILPPRD